MRRVEGVTLLDRARTEDVRWALRQVALLGVVKAKQRHGERSWSRWRTTDL